MLHAAQTSSPISSGHPFYYQQTTMSLSCLVNSVNGHIPASKRIPSLVNHLVSERAKQTIDLVGDSSLITSTAQLLKIRIRRELKSFWLAF